MVLGQRSRGQDMGPSCGPCTDATRAAFAVGAAGLEGQGMPGAAAAPPRPSLRAICSFEQQLEQEQRALQQLRQRLHREVAEEKERLDQQAARCRLGGAAHALPPLHPQPYALTSAGPAGSGGSWRS